MKEKKKVGKSNKHATKKQVKGNPMPMDHLTKLVNKTSHGSYPHRYVCSTTCSMAAIKIDSFDLACT
tara:strand:- start:953 stop:1153 length:201 start_codon:yes stop_codon:yes gene_type:complete